MLTSAGFFMSQALIDAALAVAKNAYSPYSQKRVGCAVLFAETPGTIFYGANVENASYGLTQCAERSAICTGISAGLRKIAALAIACRDKDNKIIDCFYPCGACLQVIAEFSDENTDIFLDGIGAFKLCDLLKTPFTLTR